MENVQLSKDSVHKFPKLSLRGYYQSLPKSISPKTQFLEELVSRCNVTLATVRNWVLYDIKPKEVEHRKIISEITGIREEDLW